MECHLAACEDDRANACFAFYFETGDDFYNPAVDGFLRGTEQTGRHIPAKEGYEASAIKATAEKFTKSAVGLRKQEAKARIEAAKREKRDKREERKADVAGQKAAAQADRAAKAAAYPANFPDAGSFEKRDKREERK